MYSYSLLNKIFVNKKYLFPYRFIIWFFLQERGNEKIKKIFLTQYKKKGKSTSLSLSYVGSITVETAVILPIFLIAIISFHVYFVLFNYQNVLQNSINNTAKAIARYSYIIDKSGEITDYEKLENELDIDKDILVSGINTGYAWNKIMTNEVKKYTNNSYIKGGTSGLVISGSRIGKRDGEDYIFVKYKMSFKIMDGISYNINLRNSCHFREWIGETISEKKESDSTVVYITKKGRVYHITSECTYIKFNLKTVRYGDVYLVKNNDGKSYSKCGKCVLGEPAINSIIYITGSGVTFHANKNCSYIKRDAIPIEISKVGNRKLCSRCNSKYGSAEN